jgi:hypothetical protein
MISAAEALASSAEPFPNDPNQGSRAAGSTNQEEILLEDCLQNLERQHSPPLWLANQIGGRYISLRVLFRATSPDYFSTLFFARVTRWGSAGEEWSGR